jgi:hypothetical protein
MVSQENEHALQEEREAVLLLAARVWQCQQCCNINGMKWAHETGCELRTGGGVRLSIAGTRSGFRGGPPHGRPLPCPTLSPGRGWSSGSWSSCSSSYPRCLYLELHYTHYLSRPADRRATVLQAAALLPPPPAWPHYLLRDVLGGEGRGEHDVIGAQKDKNDKRI